MAKHARNEREGSAEELELSPMEAAETPGPSVDGTVDGPQGRHASASPSRPTFFSFQKLWTRIVFTVAVLLILQPLFLGCNLLAASLPRGPIDQHLAESQASNLLSQTYERGHKFLGSEVVYDNNRFLVSIAQQHDYGNVFVTSLVATVDDYDPTHEWSWNHWRYWHGWQLLTDLCFLIGPIDVLVVVSFLLITGALVFLLLQMRKYIGWIPAICFVLLTYLSSGVYGNFLGDITMAISMAVMTFFAAGILWVGKWDSPCRSFYVSFLCVIGGAFFNYVDFLTIPEFALGVTVFCALLTQDLRTVSVKLFIGRFFKFAILFGVGFLFTWAMKWVLVSLVLGMDFVTADLAAEATLWTASDASVIYERPRWYEFYEENPRIYAIFIGAYETVGSGNLAGKIGAVACVLCILFGLFQLIRALTFQRMRNFPGTLIRNELLLNLVVLYVPFYAFVMYMHTVWHLSSFGYKGWGLVIGVLATTFLKIGLDLMRARTADVRISSSAGSFAESASSRR